MNFLEDPIQVSIKFYPHDYANWSEDLKEQANREVIAYVKAFPPGFVANQSRSVMMESLQKSRELVAKKRMELQRQEERYSELENFLFDTFSYDGAHGNAAVKAKIVRILSSTCTRRWCGTRELCHTESESFVRFVEVHGAHARRVDSLRRSITLLVFNTASYHR